MKFTRALVTITDLTRMQGDHICVAGYLRDGTCIRPLFEWKPLTESWVWLNGEVAVRPFAEIEFELQAHRPQPPHTEDWLVNPTYYRPLRLLDEQRKRSLLQKIEDNDVASIFGAPITQLNGWFVKAGQGSRSLGTVQANVSHVTYELKPGDRWDYRMHFTDGGGARYALAVTDLAFRNYLDYARKVKGTTPNQAALQLTGTIRDSITYLRIGLARGWEKYPDRCHLQITGVHTFPDYLGGKCFADFVPTEAGSKHEEVPF